jgi:hypothetical protein
MNTIKREQQPDRERTRNNLLPYSALERLRNGHGHDRQLEQAPGVYDSRLVRLLRVTSKLKPSSCLDNRQFVNTTVLERNFSSETSPSFCTTNDANPFVVRFSFKQIIFSSNNTCIESDVPDNNSS